VEPTVWEVFWVGVLSDLSTALGVLPFVFFRKASARWQGLAAGYAGGMMVGASIFSLVDEGLRRGSTWETVAGLLLGALFVVGLNRFVAARDWQVSGLSAADSRRAILFILAMFIQSIPEGLAIGVGFATGELRFGLLLGLAIAIHNIPEGIAVSLSLRAKGVSLWRCAAYAIFTSLPQPVFGVPAFLVVSLARYLVPAGLGFAGGAMIYLAISELLVDAFELGSRQEMAWSFTLGLVTMLLVVALLGFGY
jgi:ZIP family zinc transporter